jgi:hypothetical protein
MQQMRASWPRLGLWLALGFGLDLGFGFGFWLGRRFVRVLVLVGFDPRSHFGQLATHALEFGARRVLVDQARFSFGETLV